MNFFEQNLQSLILQNPNLGTQLFGYKGNERFEVFQDPSDTLNVNLLDHKSNKVMYQGVPREEVLVQVDVFEKEFNRYPLLFIYGVANGLFIKLLLQNENHIRIIVIEPELELLYISLNLIDFSKEIEEKRVVFLLENEVNFVKSVEIFSNPSLKVYCRTYHMELNTHYYEHFYGPSLLRCNVDIMRAIEHVVTGLGNDTTDALIGLEWHLKNVSTMVETPSLDQLIKKAKTTDIAIVISTGPSLSKQLPLLKLIKEHVTLLSVDASLPILEKYDIKPDIVFSIERVADTAEFYKKTSRKFQEGIICSISSVSHPLLIESVNGATLQINMRPFGYTRYFDLPKYGYIGIGMSAANMAYELAFHSKFKTIILIGQDLAYGKDGQSHSDGHVLGSLKTKETDFEVEAYGGIGNVRTNKVWNIFRNFFENDLHFTNQQDVLTINATEGGARIHGAVEMPFSEAIEQYIDRSIIKAPIVLTNPDASTIEKQKLFVETKIDFMEKYVETMQKLVSDIFAKISVVVEKLNKIKARKNIQHVNYDELSDLMLQIDVVKEKFEDKEFTDIFIDTTQAMIVHLEMEIAKIQVRAIHNDDDRRLKMIDWIYIHHNWSFTLAGIMEAELVAIKRRGSQSRFVHSAQLDDSAESITGYFYDFSGKDSNFQIDLIVDNERVISKTIDVLGSQKGNFTFSIPARFYNDQVHNILVREKHTGIVLSGMPDVRLFLSVNRVKAEFMESLDHINTDEIKNLYCKDAIGFLAVEENLNDQDFMNYIKELMVRFPAVEFKGFCFNEIQKELLTIIFKQFDTIDFKIVCDISEILKSVEIYLWDVRSRIDYLVAVCIVENSYYITPCTNYGSGLIFNLNNSSLHDFDSIILARNEPILLNAKEYGFLKDEIEVANGSFHRLIYSELFKRLESTSVLVDLNTDAVEFYSYIQIELFLKYKKFKNKFNSLYRYRQSNRDK